LNSLKRLFHGEAFDVFATTDYKQALACLEQEPVKVILSDQKMPDISGVEVLRQVKEIKPAVLRILFTGYADIQVAEDAINQGEVYRFINKPWDDTVLKATIKEAIERFDLLEHNRQLTEQIKEQNEELLSLNQKLQNMYEAQRSFSSTVSHELKTPLAAIKMAIDIIMSETPGALNGQQKDFLQKAKNNVDRLGRLVHDILSLTRLESGKTKLELIEGDLAATIKDVVEIQSSVASQKNIYLKMEKEEALPAVAFDQDKIHQVLHNLISNAIKFTEQGGITVSVAANNEKNYVQVAVQDTGYGIAEADIPKLFNKFQQLGDPEKRKEGGTGLGLAICKEIVSQHQGKIWVESSAGKGSSFCFLLPIKERRQERHSSTEKI